MNRRGAAKWAAVVFFIVRGPRTVSELAALVDTKYEVVRRYLGQLEEEGLVARGTRRASTNARGPGPTEWAWTP